MLNLFVKSYLHCISLPLTLWKGGNDGNPIFSSTLFPLPTSPVLMRDRIHKTDYQHWNILAIKYFQLTVIALQCKRI